MFPCLNLFYALCEKDAAALAIGLGFHYEGLILGELFAQLAVLSWK